MGLPLREQTKPVVHEIEMEDLAGSTIGIDSFAYLYSYLMAARSQGQALNHEGKYTSHLGGFFFRIKEMLQNDIKPVFVIEGRKIALKKETLDERRQKRDQMKKEAAEALAEGDYKTYNKKIAYTETVKNYMLVDLKNLVESFGLPFIVAGGEGEAQLAYMNSKGDIDYVVTQDYDALLFDSKIVVRNLLKGRTMRRGNKIIEIKREMIKVDEFINHHDITKEQLIDIAILNGTDFNKGVSRVGIKTAMKYIKKYGNIEETMKSITKVREELDIEKVNEVRNAYFNPLVNKDYSMEFKRPDIKKIYYLMVKKFGFNTEKIERYLGEIKVGETNLDYAASL